MCILLVAEGAKLHQMLQDYPQLGQSMYRRNSDGLGIMWHTDDGTVATHKAMPKSAEEASATITAIMPTDSRLVAVHYRQRTSGAIDESQCHPYLVHDGIFLMHNGVLDIEEPKPAMSDTWHFIRKYLRNMPSDIINNDSVRSMMGDLIGSGNRFVIATPGGNMHIINEATGYYHHDVWFSNHYAWDVSILEPDYYARRGKGKGKGKGKGNTNKWYSYYSTWGDWDKGLNADGEDYGGDVFCNDARGVEDAPLTTCSVDEDAYYRSMEALERNGYDTLMGWFGGYLPKARGVKDYPKAVQEVYKAMKQGRKSDVDTLCATEPEDIFDWAYAYTGYLPVE